MCRVSFFFHSFLLFFFVFLEFFVFLWALVCDALYARVLRFIFGVVNRFKSCILEYKERPEGLFCYIRTWDGVRMKRVCVLVEDHDIRLPRSELLCLSRVMCSVNGSSYPVAFVGGSSSVVTCLNSIRSDGMVFVPYRASTSGVFLNCVQQAHQDVFGMLDIVTVIEYLMVRLRTALYEDGSLDTLPFSVLLVLDKCHLKIFVELSRT